jgi:hypothetical protein
LKLGGFVGKVSVFWGAGNFLTWVVTKESSLYALYYTSVFYAFMHVVFHNEIVNATDFWFIQSVFIHYLEVRERYVWRLGMSPGNRSYWECMWICDSDHRAFHLLVLGILEVVLPVRRCKLHSSFTNCYVT